MIRENSCIPGFCGNRQNPSLPTQNIATDLDLQRCSGYNAMISVFETFTEFRVSVYRLLSFHTGLKSLADSQLCPIWRKQLPFIMNNLLVGYGCGDKYRIRQSLRKNQPSCGVLLLRWQIPTLLNDYINPTEADINI